MHGIQRLPARLRIVNETGSPSDTDVFDADTGEKVQGVFSASIERDALTIEATLNWPTTKDDLVIMDRDRWHGPQHSGIKTMILTIPIRKLFVETW